MLGLYPFYGPGPDCWTPYIEKILVPGYNLLQISLAAM